MDTEQRKNAEREYWYYQDLYKETFGTYCSFWINETDEIGKMKRAIETGKEYDLGKDPDYADISGIVI